MKHGLKAKKKSVSYWFKKNKKKNTLRFIITFPSQYLSTNLVTWSYLVVDVLLGFLAELFFG